MANPDFASILNRTTGTIERPPTMPIGEYIWKIKGLPRYDKSSVKSTPFAEFVCVPIKPLDSVDTDALEECLNRKTGKKLLSDMIQKITFYLTEDATYRLKEFAINDLKVATEDEANEMTLSALIELMPNSEFIGTINHTPSKDGKSVYANLGSTAPVE